VGEGDFGGEEEEEDLERVSIAPSARRQEWGGVSAKVGQMGVRGDAVRPRGEIWVREKEQAAEGNADEPQSPSLM
jgi:hypothetical protein